MVDKKIKLFFISLILIVGITFFSWSEIMIFADSDKDGISDAEDNCPYDKNFDQIDFDLDSFGDVCDPDDDNDGIEDTLDLFDKETSEWSDFDADSIGDNKDTDDDNDGVSDSLD
ncbi:MAG: thrombospondin type 3 repeat-containing protein, partial [Candidatus Nitrosomaritimum yanchengensis]